MDNIYYYTTTFRRHFDNIIFHYNKGTGMEPIRRSYKKMFGIGIGLFDIMTTEISLDKNPINRIITLIGPVNETIDKYNMTDLPYGIMPSSGEIVYVSFLDKNILDEGIDSNKEYSNMYINNVFCTIDDIIANDIIYKLSNHNNGHAYYELINMLPFYISWHHIDSCIPRAMNITTFKNIASKYLVDGDDNIDILIDSLSNKRFSSNSEDIYCAITANGKIRNSILR